MSTNPSSKHNINSREEAVYKLLEERNQAEKNFETLKALQLSANGNIDPDTDILAEMIKVSFEKECLKREVAELSDRVIPLEKSCRQLEIDNERLSFKLSEALAEIEERETQLGLSERQNVWFTEMKNRHSADSTPPSLLLSELASFGSPKKLSSMLETCNELAWAEEVKKLQCESENLRSQLTVLGEKYNALVLKHIQYKTKRKFQIEEVRERLQACECQVETLQTQLSIQRQRLRAEELFRKQIEADYRRLQEERRSISSR
ncbi:unnamed protein product [Nezara viridula]|uniref:Uncharacterized protein n=1 Tax=Nezara viridula TaxID=85310 RepID=A0A9P0EBC6_NEZVI|nr:unnamed protein product [Nezara viridula]